ncbi:MAG: glycosyltransferase family 4 protein [Ignavibacteria bacterium]|nr:glycosyltransferase family 4 protein [Ignavibacteria bacterium]
MRVLFVGRYNTSESIPGPEKVAKRVYDLFARDARDEVAFVEYFFGGPGHGAWKKMFGSEHRSTVPGDVRRLGLARMPHFILRFRPDAIVIATYERFAVVPLLLAVFTGIPVLTIVHGVVRYENAHFRREIPRALARRDRVCEGLLFRFSDRLAFLSDAERDIAGTFGPIEDGRVALVANGVDDAFFAQEPPRSHGEGGPLRVLFAGDEARPEKGWATVREALAACRAPVALTMVTNRVSGREEIANPAVTVRRVAPMPDEAFARFMPSFDCIVLASSYETFSLVAVEALAAGLAGIVTRETGMSRFVEDGISALLFDAGDAPTLQGHIERLAADRDLLQALSVQGRAAVAGLAWPTIAAHYRTLLVRMIASRKERGQ